MVEKTRVENKAYMKRAKYLREVIKCDDKIERFRWREKLPLMLEWKLRRKRKLELRKQKKEEQERTLKKPRTAPLRVNKEPGRFVHVKLSSESEKSEPESDMEEVYDGVDEQPPKCKRIIGEKANKKKKGGKKKNDQDRGS